MRRMKNPPKKKKLPLTFPYLVLNLPFLIKKLKVAFSPTTKYNPRRKETLVKQVYISDDENSMIEEEDCAEEEEEK